MEYRLGAMASFLRGPRDLQCAIVVLQEGSSVISFPVGKAFRDRDGTLQMTADHADQEARKLGSGPRWSATQSNLCLTGSAVAHVD